MKGDRLIFKKEFEQVAQLLANKVLIKLKLPGHKEDERNYVKHSVAVCGESGSGKSVSSRNLGRALQERGYQCLVLSMDDYFKLPPRSNHEKRIKDISHIGPSEIHLDLLNQHIQDFKHGVSPVASQLVHYEANKIESIYLDLKAFDFLIVEGTYSAMLDSIDCCIFLSHSYKQTREKRLARGREQDSEFIEKVLAIEHEIIRELAANADILLDSDYRIVSD
jgi:uridine kinase